MQSWEIDWSSLLMPLFCFFRSGRVRQEYDRETNEVSMVVLALCATCANYHLEEEDSIIEARLHIHMCCLFLNTYRGAILYQLN